MRECLVPVGNSDRYTENMLHCTRRCVHVYREAVVKDSMELTI